MERNIIILLLLMISQSTFSQTNHTDGQTKLINPEGRTLILERDNNDSWLTFHD